MMTGADADQFSLKWNNFHKNLQSGFHSLLQEVDLVDVTLAAEGQFVQAHKIVLSVCSPYFKQLFKVNPCKHPIVILKDVSHKELIAILQFMYQGEVNVNQEELATFLKTAELLQVKGLTGNDSEMEDDSNENSSPLFQPLPQKRPSSTNLHEVTQIYHDTNKRPHRANDNERVISAPPPIKRMHSELAPKPLSPPVKTNDELETFEIRIPKMETVEIDSDPEVSENSMQEDPLSQLLSSESSHQEMKIGANSDLSNVPGVSQDANNQGVSPVSGRLRYKCFFCNSWYSSRGNRKVHMNDKHSGTDATWKCIFCAQELKNYSSLRTHIRKVHNEKVSTTLYRRQQQWKDGCSQSAAAKFDV